MKDNINSPDKSGLTQQGSISWPGNCHWGQAAVQRALRVAGTRMKRPLVVTDTSVWQALAPALTPVFKHLDIHCYSAVQPNPSLGQIREALAVARQADCDGVIAVGGGSVIDVAKMVFACLAGGLSVDEIQSATGQAWLDADASAADPVFLAVPTTSGTGSESSSAALIQTEDGRKRLFRSLRTRPNLVALQPDLTLSLPRPPTAQGGFDAVLHALGAWVNTDPSPIGKAAALQALALCFKALPAVLQMPSDIQARADMQMGSYLAGIAIGMCKVDAIHGMCTPLEARVHMAHAEVLAPVFGVVARYTVQTHPERYAQAANMFGISHTGEPAQDALALIEFVEALARQGGIATTFADFSLTPTDAEQLAQQALQSASTPLNPRPLAPNDIAALYLQLAKQGVQA